ncbi:MAG: DUF1844 domain-containing protein [Deltaproteobacteria bacterium]|nr:DUF1844 domain-containing protein [Deltaproteobacteria bacterium]
MEDEKKEKGFVIKDKRFFDESGEARKEELKSAIDADEKREKAPESPEEKPDAQPREDSFPEVTFSSFIFSLSTTAMFHFGDLPDPVTKKSGKNLAAAKQTIDMLDMLKNKTLGNLDNNEKELLDGLLYELKMRYVKEKTP